MSTLGQILGYIGLAVAGAVIWIAVALIVGSWFGRMIRRQRRRETVYLTDDLIRQCRFFDDQIDPRELIG